MSEPEKSFWEELGRELGKGTAELRADFREVQQEARKLGLDVKKSVWDTMSEAERLAAKAAIKAEEVWEDFDVNDRLYGSTGGAKLGALFGLRAGPKGAAVGAAGGAIIGFLVGDKAVQKFRRWKDGHKEISNDDNPQTPSASDKADKPDKPNGP